MRKALNRITNVIIYIYIEVIKSVEEIRKYVIPLGVNVLFGPKVVHWKFDA